MAAPGEPTVPPHPRDDEADIERKALHALLRHWEAAAAREALAATAGAAAAAGGGFNQRRKGRLRAAVAWLEEHRPGAALAPTKLQQPAPHAAPPASPGGGGAGAAAGGARKRVRSKSLSRAAKRRAVGRKAFERGGAGGGDDASSADPWDGTVDCDEEGAGSPAARFEAYYRAQGVCGTGAGGGGEGDMGDMLAAMRRPLPVSFRWNATRGAAAAVAEAKEELSRLAGEGAAQPLLFVEGASLRSGGASRDALRRAEDGSQGKALHRWLVSAARRGVITRQEVVSMVPAALLGVEPGHAVLDMCAAPGSKTTQLLEALEGDGGAMAALGGGGVLVANDFDAVRAYTLARRCEPLREANAKLVVTNHAAQRFPNPRAGEGPEAGGPYPAGCFDRIVADVPCSGDGTMRKHPAIWGRWGVGMAISHHSMQLQVACRGAALLKVGGMMAYSTCSLSPIEDEAVVAELLRRCGGALELVDASGLLPGLERRPGLRTWGVCDGDLSWYDTYDDARARSPAPGLFAPSMWPPPPGAGGRAAPPLERCLRLLPHLQDTGGFFVALLRKRAPLPGPPGRPPRPLPPPGGTRLEPRPPRPSCAHLDYRPLGAAGASELRELLGLNAAFDAEVAPHLLVRSPSGGLRAGVAAAAPLAYAHATAPRVHAVRAGVALAARSVRRSGGLELTHAGARLLVPYTLPGRRVPLSPEDAKLLRRRGGRPVQLARLSKRARNVARKVPDGPCVAVEAGPGGGAMAARRLGGDNEPAVAVAPPERLGK